MELNISDTVLRVESQQVINPNPEYFKLLNTLSIRRNNNTELSTDPILRVQAIEKQVQDYLSLLRLSGMVAYGNKGNEVMLDLQGFVKELSNSPQMYREPANIYNLQRLHNDVKYILDNPRTRSTELFNNQYVRNWQIIPQELYMTLILYPKIRDQDPHLYDQMLADSIKLYRIYDPNFHN